MNKKDDPFDWWCEEDYKLLESTPAIPLGTKIKKKTYDKHFKNLTEEKIDEWLNKKPTK